MPEEPSDGEAAPPAFADLERIQALARELSFVEDPRVLEACLEQAERMFADIDLSAGMPNAGTPTGHQAEDPSHALLAVYDRPRQETSAGPLANFSFAIKDNMAVAGLPMTGGLADHEYVPSYDAIIVERILDAGGSIVGKANLDALALGPEGVWSEIAQVQNSIDPERVPGGSSSGSAVAVATGQVDAAIGSDAGGSIRKPAAYNELVGIKPTQGIVPTHGKISCATTLGSVGPIAETVETAARILDVIAGPDLRDPATSQVDLGAIGSVGSEPFTGTIGVPDSFMACADAEVAAVIEQLRDRIADETECEIETVALDNSVSRLPGYLSGAELGWLIRQDGVDHGAGRPTDPAWYHLLSDLQAAGFNEHITRRKLPGAYLDAATDGQSYMAAYELMLEFRERLATVFEDVEVLLSPTVPAVPPRLDADIENLPRNLSINCQPFNLTGAPAVAVPAGRTDGLPVSAQLAAAPYDDVSAMRAGALVEGLTA